jgi:hypothetical protein
MLPALAHSVLHATHNTLQTFLELGAAAIRPKEQRGANIFTLVVKEWELVIVSGQGPE